MKKAIFLAACLAALTCAPTFGQYPPTINPQTGLPIPSPKPRLTKFNLDFHGGTPSQLVAAIEKAMGKPLNAIIPPDDENVELPPLKMNNVDVAQLFDALQAASVKNVPQTDFPMYGLPRGATFQRSHGFVTSGVATDDSIWRFYVQKPPPPPSPPPAPPPVCRYYLLTPYLDKGLTVDDITTAIQTGWKMMGVHPMPELSFHKETKLLIAVGQPDKLETIDAVLKALKPTPQPTVINPQTGLPMPPGSSAMGPFIGPRTGVPMRPEKPKGNN